MVDFKEITYRVGNVEVTTGAVLKSDGSAMKTKTGGWKSMRPVTDHKKCIACGNCWVFCPEGCVYKRKDDGKFQADYDFCKGCGICPQVCPVKCITMVPEEK
jgi:pyruvate ferredoxin oxidoreductase delta subunit